MKNVYLHGSLFLLLCCLATLPLAGQTTPGSQSATTLRHYLATDAQFSYSGVSISAPAITAGEEFTISLTVHNTARKEGKHEVKLYRQQGATLTSRLEQATKLVELGPGMSKDIAFTLRAEDLLTEGEALPDSFVFFVGKYEIGVDYLQE